jgi:uncharacterized protein YdhG (YjbR/CyaY superfamily)
VSPTGPNARSKNADIDAYLAALEPRRRAALRRLRSTMRKIVPRADEVISYGIPAFRLDGRIVGGFAATKKGCSYFPFSGTTLKTLAHDLEDYAGTKSSLHFDPEKGLPVALVRKLIRNRIAEEAARRPKGHRGRS